MALQLHFLKDETDWEKNFPMELYGWLRRHSALVNPGWKQKKIFLKN